MGKYDAERAALGLPPLSSSSSSDDDIDQKFGKYATERRRLAGEVQTYEFDPVAERKQKAEETIAASPSLGSSLRSPIKVPEQALKKVTPAQELQQPKSETAQIRDKQDPSNPILKWVKDHTVDALASVLDPVSENKALNKVGEIGRALYTPGAGGAAVNALTQGAERTVGLGAARLAKVPAVEKFLLNQGIHSPNLVSNIAKTAATEAAVGAPLGAAQYLSNQGATGKADLGEAAKQAGIGAVLGGAIGGALPAAGASISKFADTPFGTSLANLAKRKQAVPEELEKRVSEALNASKQKTVTMPGLLRPASQESYINKVMGEINPIVTERMTPPLENPNELAKWLQPHFGNESLNEIRKFSYDDMVQLANEVRSSLSTADIAKQVAKERGYNLMDILNGKLPSIGERAKQDASKRAYGIYDGQKVEISRPVTPQQLEKAAVVVEDLPVTKDSWFTKLFGHQGVGISAGGKNTQRTGTGIQIVDNPLKKDANTVMDQAKEYGRAVKQDYVDTTAPLKYLGDDVQEVALDARRANNLANVWVQDKAVTPEGVVIGPGLKEVAGSVPRGQFDAFEDYLVVRHAKTRVARGERVYDDKLGMNDVLKLEARQSELERKYPQLKELGKKWDEYHTRLLDTGKEFGLISEVQKKSMREQNPNYASMRRQFSTSEKFSQPFAMRTNSFSGQKAPIKAVSPTGSARKIVSPVRSSIEQTGAWMNAGMRNRVMQKILSKVEANPEEFKGLVEIVGESSEASAKSLKQINDVLSTDGMDGLSEFLNNEYAVAFRKASQTSGKTDNIVTVMVKGTPVKMKVNNPEIFKALVGLGPEESNFVLDFFGALSNATKRGATGPLAPLFAAKSFSVDLAQALIQSKDPIRHMPDLIHATISSIANKLPKGTPGFEKLRELAQDFERSGGQYSASLRGDAPLKKTVGELRKDPFLSPRGVAKGVSTTVKAPFRFLEGVSDVAENANRIAAYRGEMRRLGGGKTTDNVRSAMRESQEITTNFSRKGAKSNTIEKFFPYSNAAVQSLRRFGVQLKKNPVKTSLMVGGFVVGPKLWEQAKFGDDPDYQKLPARTRYRNIIVRKNSDGTFVQVPMPPEYQAIGALAADAMSEIKGQDYVKWRDVSDALVNTYTPPFISGGLQGATQGGGVDQSGWGVANASSAGPLVGMLANQSWTGAPIVSQAYQNNSPYMQRDERTSKPSEWLSETQVGKSLGLSPMKVDYLIKQYGGDLARLGLPLTSDVGGGTPKNTLLKNFIVDPTFTNNLSRDYYNRIEKVKNISADIGDGAATPSWYNDAVKKLATGTAKGDPSRKLKDLNATKREIQGNTAITAEVKANRLRNVQSEINNIYLDVLFRLDEMGVSK